MSILREILESLNVDDVKWRATLEGLPVKGRKADIIQRIIDKDEENRRKELEARLVEAGGEETSLVAIGAPPPVRDRGDSASGSGIG